MATPLYSTEYLIDRLYNTLKQKGKLNTKAKIKLVRPSITRKNRRTNINNINDVATAMNRTSQELTNYLVKELSISTYSFTGDGALKCVGFIDSKKICTAIENYAMNYVVCKQCKSTNTCNVTLHRKIVCKCNDCHSTTDLSS